MMKYNYSERGRSMVEMMGYLAVMMAVVVAIGRIVSNVFDTHRYSTASLQVTELATAIVKAGAIDVDYREILKDINGDGNLNGVDGAKGDDTMKLIPTSFRRAGNKIYHVFGGTVAVGCSLFESPSSGEETCNGKRIDQFSITFDHLSKKQCTELAMKNWQSNKYIDLFALRVNSTIWFWPAYVSTDDEGTNVKVFPVKRATLTGTDDDNAVCQDGDSNTLTWVFN